MDDIRERQGEALISSGYPEAGGWMEHRLPDWPRLWGACRRRIGSWPIPPRWSAIDWHEEIAAEGIAAACKAIHKYDPGRGTALGTFVYIQVIAGALTRYRQEWSYARRCSSVGQDSIPQVDDGTALDNGREELGSAMSRLDDDDRRLLERLYWDGSTEAAVAGMMGISQQAVSKKKLKVLSELRRGIGGGADP